ncbi:MAG: hypothetical protein WAW36_18650 [Methylovulum miyakonense]|uniref:hypothetical protein n=1 Tax=Methylovulum miyakonense TaxID=645578 RepID=UPI003BB53375
MKITIPGHAFVLLCSLCLTARAETPQMMTVQGLIHEQRTDVKSLGSWNAPGDPFYVVEIAGGDAKNVPRHLVLLPTEQVSTQNLQKFAGHSVALKGYFSVGERPATPLASITEQVPVEPKWEGSPQGQWANTGWQVMGRGSGFVMQAIATAPSITMTIPGAVVDYEWAHASSRLALLVVDGRQQGRVMVIDAGQTTPVAEFTIPQAYRPRCFAWLGDDAGFLLAMAKPEHEDDVVEDNFYRYTFAGRQFETVYQDIERQFAHVFSIEVDQGSMFWAAASVGEGHSDLAVYQDARTVLMTDVYPGSIAPLFWQGHHLWAVTEAYLEFGFTRNERARHPHFNTLQYPERDWGDVVAYRIDPATQQSVRGKTEMAALQAALDMSHDHRYRAGLTRTESSAILTIVPQAPK